MAVGKHKIHNDTINFSETYYGAPLEGPAPDRAQDNQRNPHLRDTDLDPHGSATILSVMVCAGLLFMFIFGAWVGMQWLG